MRIFKIACFCLSLSLSLLVLSCGKSPLLNKKSSEISGNFGVEAQKILPNAGINLSISWLSKINSTDAGVAILMSTKNGELFDLPAPYSIYLWMPTMNHGSSPITVSHLSTGIYKLTDLYFIMDGYWQLRTQLKSGNTLLEEVFFEYNL